jgi:hypothetical protein
MPKEYRGGVAAVIKKSAPIAPPPKPIAVPQPVAPKPVTPAPVAAAPVAGPAKPAKKSAMPYVVLGLGVFLILVASVIAFYAYQQTAKPPAVTIPPSSTPKPTPTPTPEPPKKPEAGLDSDSDGLTDVEELRLFGTLVFNPDTDSDSFLDGNEVFHLYDPAKQNFARLADSALVKLYSSSKAKFTLFTPSSFVATESADGLSATWGIPSGENIRVTSYPNPDKQSAQVWFAATFPARAAEAMSSFATKGGFQGIQDPDRRDTFIDGGNGMIYRIEYLLGPAKSIEYRTTYNMMLNSFTAAQ